MYIRANGDPVTTLFDFGQMKFHRHLHYTLVLGRENSGLPLEVLNEMDVCCQIPQQGVLRSLNAHVSGAIVLAEYSRQMLV